MPNFPAAAEVPGDVRPVYEQALSCLLMADSARAGIHASGDSRASESALLDLRERVKDLRREIDSVQPASRLNVRNRPRFDFPETDGAVWGMNVYECCERFARWIIAAAWGTAFGPSYVQLAWHDVPVDVKFPKTFQRKWRTVVERFAALPIDSVYARIMAELGNEAAAAIRPKPPEVRPKAGRKNRNEERDREIIKLAGEGKKLSVIAKRLGLSKARVSQIVNGG